MNQIVTYYNELANDYDENRFKNSYGNYIDKQERGILNILLNKKENILDLACGTGRLSNYATSGVDASVNMVEIARKKYPEKAKLIVSYAESYYKAMTS